MSVKRRSGSICAFLLATLLSFGGISCIATGFALRNVNLGALLIFCMGISLLWAVVSRFRFGILITAALLEILWVIPNSRLVIDSEKALLHIITGAYHRGYGWPMLTWETGVPVCSADYALGMIAAVVSLVVVWTVFRQKKATLAALVAFLPLLSCFVLTDTVPDDVSLFVMLVGILLLVLTNTLRRRDAKLASRATALLLVPVLLVTGGLFRVAPRDGYVPSVGVLSRLGDWLLSTPLGQYFGGQVPGWMSGDPGLDEIPLDTLGGKSPTDEVAFRVTAGKNGYLYLRGRGYDSYDGKHWTATGYSSGTDSGWADVRQGAVSVTVQTKEALKYYYFPGESGPGLAMSFENGKIDNKEELTIYTFMWGTPLRGASLDLQVRRQCLLLPMETAAWAKEVLRSYGLTTPMTNQEREMTILTIGNLVRSSASYSLEPETMPAGEKDFAKWFFTEAESGYCVHFATTATVLLRAAGIPARYATGYALQVKAEEETAVTQSKAHAWVEYYDEIKGWTILDVTPGFNQTIIPTDPTAPTTEPTEPTFTRPTLPTEPTTEPSAQPTQPSQTLPGPTTHTPSTQTPTPVDNAMTRTAITVILWMLVICVAVWGQYFLRLRIRRWYWRHGIANRQALNRWKSVRIRSRLFRQKLPTRLYQLAEKAKFSQHMLTEAELKEFDLHMAALAATLQEKPWLLRWLLRLVFAIER